MGEFQFYYGSINSRLSILSWLILNQFQFYYGSINRGSNPTKGLFLNVFQFYYGSINSRFIFRQCAGVN